MANMQMVNFIIFCLVVLFAICVVIASAKFIWNNIGGILFLVCFIIVCWVVYFGIGFNPKFA